MIESVAKEREQIRIERKTLIKDAILLAIVAIALFAFLWTWKGSITGYSALETFESNISSVSESSPGSTLSFEAIPDMRLHVGEEVSFRVVPNTNGPVTFSDNTQLFEIEQDGTVHFTPKNKGHHRVFIIITNTEREYYMQDFRILIR